MFGVITGYANDHRSQMSGFHRSVPRYLRDFDIRKVARDLWRYVYILDVGPRQSMRFRLAGTAIEDGMGGPLKGQELASMLYKGNNSVLVQGIRNCISGSHARYFFHIGPLTGNEHLVLQASAQLMRSEPESTSSNVIGMMFINYPSPVTGRNYTYFESDLDNNNISFPPVGSG